MSAKRESSPAVPEAETPAEEKISAQQLSDAFARMLGSEEAAPRESDSPQQGQDAASSTAGEAEPSEPTVDESTCPVTPKRVLEAMLFVGHPDNEPLTREQASSVIHGVHADEIDSLVEHLNTDYAAGGHAMRIVAEASGYRLALCEDLERVRRRFYGRVRQARLSQAAIEVLALIAYNQPMTSEAVSKLRGHPSGAILTQLVRRQLLCRERPSEKPRTPQYRTTARFLELFGLDSLEDLPRSQELEA